MAITGRGHKSSGQIMLERAYSAVPKISPEEKAGRAKTLARARFRENMAAGIAELKEASGELLRTSGLLCEAETLSDSDFTKQVEDFAQSYSLACKAVEDSDRFLESSSVDLDGVTASYKKALESVGIYNDGQSMTVREEELERNVAEAKKLFGSRFSYGSRIARKAAILRQIAGSAENTVGIYDRTGKTYKI